MPREENQDCYASFVGKLLFKNRNELFKSQVFCNSGFSSLIKFAFKTLAIYFA